MELVGSDSDFLNHILAAGNYLALYVVKWVKDIFVFFRCKKYCERLKDKAGSERLAYS